MTKTCVLVHGRHMETEGWEKLVWGDGPMIGAAPFGLYLALQKGARLVFGTGASEKDGLKECAYTRRFLESNLERLRDFPEFLKKYWRWDDTIHGMVYDQDERARVFSDVLNAAHLDIESVDTASEVKNAVAFAKSIRATELIQVSSPFHVERCAKVSAELLEDGFDFGDVIPMTASSKSSTEKCRASTTVILEHPHRGDDPMIASSLAPHQVFPRMFRLSPKERMEFFRETDKRLTALGK